MKGRALFAALLPLAAGCSTDFEDNAVPKIVDIERLEAKLAQHPCVGDLGQWERNYRFARKSAFIFPGSLNPDLDVIELHLRRAGTVVIAPARNVMVPAPGGDWPDSRPIRSIDGRFKLSSGALDLQRCEPADPAVKA